MLSLQLGRGAAPAAVRLGRRAARRCGTSRGGAEARGQRRRHGHEVAHSLSVCRAGRHLCGVATVKVAAPLARPHRRSRTTRAHAHARSCGGHGAVEEGAASGLGGPGAAGGGGEGVAHCGGQRRRGGGVARGGQRARDRARDRARPAHAAQSRGVVAARDASTGRREGGVDVSLSSDPALDALVGGGARELRATHPGRPTPQRTSPAAARLSSAWGTGTAASGTGTAAAGRGRAWAAPRHAAARTPRPRRRGGLGGPWRSLRPVDRGRRARAGPM